MMGADGNCWNLGHCSAGLDSIGELPAETTTVPVNTGDKGTRFLRLTVYKLKFRLVYSRFNSIHVDHLPPGTRIARLREDDNIADHAAARKLAFRRGVK